MCVNRKSHKASRSAGEISAITLIGLQTVVLRDIARLQPLFVYSFRPQQV
jgi:hypothetical protein